MEPTKFDLKYTSVRRAIIEQRFANLNNRQQEAVYQTEGPLLVLAGAGSGKTTVLIHRIINLLRFGKGYDWPFAPEQATQEDLAFLTGYLLAPSEENRVQAERLCAVAAPRPWEVIAITFTNKAAKELQERLVRALGEEDAAGVWAYTFHGACLRILRSNIEQLGYDKAFTIYDEDDKKRTILEAMKRLDLDPKTYDPRTVMGMISCAKDNLILPDVFAEQAKGEFFKEKTAEVYLLYEKLMHKANALDFDDIILKTVLLLQNHDDVREYYQRKFRYVLVDEYQDTNHAQYVLCALLAGGGQNICVVGDDDQSIYKFRGATIANILEFEKQYPGAKTIRLEQNYRSTSNILDTANALIRNNQRRKGKELWTEQGEGAKVHLHRSGTQEEEAAFIAETILEGAEAGRKWGEYAVLYRNNVLSNNIEGAFMRGGIPYRIYKGRDFFSRAEIRDMFAYLWVVENPADELRLRRIINVPARKIGGRSVELASEEAAKTGQILFDVVRHADEYPALSRGASAMVRFGEMIEKLREQRETLSLSELYEAILEQSGYRAAWEAKDDSESRSRIENIMELKSNIADYEAHAAEPSLAGFLEEMALFTDADHTDENEDAVLMMTMHSAKGLEFPTVFLCGMEDGLFPSFRSEEREEDMEEERRLCYVAVTRARKELYLTCAERRMLYGRTQYARPSKFLNEMPKKLLDSNMGTQQAPSIQTDVPGTSSSRVSYVSARRVGVAPQALSEAPDFAAGDRVKHRVFGEGMVVSVKPMGGDALLEIAFDTKGTKRLMGKQAGQFMEKI